MEGTAPSTGGAGGRYLYRYGDDWGDAKGKISSEEFAATMTLDAYFAAGTIGGCLGCEGDIEVQSLHLASAFQAFETAPVSCWPIPGTMNCIWRPRVSIRTGLSRPTKA